MPEAYLTMKKKFMSEGMSEKEAATKAAKIYNSTHKKNPIGPHSDKEKK